MSEIGIPVQALPGTEMIATMDGNNILIGKLPQTPVKLIFDNLSTVAVTIFTSFDGGTTLNQWKTFAAGSALVLDNDFSAFSKGMSIYGNGASGQFSVTYTYLKQ